jgi:hypothetical protein
MANTHGIADFAKEVQSICYDLLPACLLTSAGVTAPGSGLTLAAASCTAYARSGIDLKYIDQPAVSVTVPNVAGSHWLIAHHDTHSAVASWTRRAGSHFLTQQSATQPTIPDGATLVAQLTVAGGNITAVDTSPAFSPPLSRQTADAVAITDGAITLAGASAGSTGANLFPLRLYPVAPTGITTVHPLRVEAATGANLASASLAALVVANPPTMASVRGLQSSISAGTGRYNLFCDGGAANYLVGATQVGGPLGAMGGQLVVRFAKGGNNGVQIQPTDSDTGTPAVVFSNLAGSTVGSITTTASATAYNTSSDRRLKRNVQPLVGALATLRQVRPVSYLWNVNDEAGIGFLADELMVPVPSAVTGVPDQVDANGQIVPQGVDHSKLVPLLTAALQEMAQRLEALEEALGV